jgi:hypothetical protein
MPKQAMKPMTHDERYLLRWIDRTNTDPTPTLEFEQRDELDRWLDKEEHVAEKAFQSRDKAEKELGREDLAAIRHGERLTEKDESLHEKVIKLDIAKAKQEKEEKQARLEDSKKRAQQAETITGLVKQTVGDKVGETQEKVGKALFSLSQWTTPGGIGLLVVLLLLLAATVVPVNAAGDTRLKQFWYMLAGRASLQGRMTPVAGGIAYTDKLSINDVIGSVLTSMITSSIPQAATAAFQVAAAPGVGIPLIVGEIGAQLIQNQFRTNFGGQP